MFPRRALNTSRPCSTRRCKVFGARQAVCWCLSHSDHISLSLALSGRPDTHYCPTGHQRHGRHRRGAHAGPHGRQSDDETSQTPLRREYSLRSDRGEWRRPVFLTSCLCRRAQPSALCLPRSPWRSSSTLRCDWPDSLKRPVIQFWLCRSTRIRTLLSWRLVPTVPSGLAALPTAPVCVPVPLCRRDDAGHGLRRHHLPGPVAQDPTASRLSTSAWTLGAAGLPRPRFTRERAGSGAAVGAALKHFLCARISRRRLHRGPRLASQALHRGSAQLPERRPGTEPPARLAGLAVPRRSLTFSLFDQLRRITPTLTHWQEVCHVTSAVTSSFDRFRSGSPPVDSCRRVALELHAPADSDWITRTSPNSRVAFIFAAFH